MEYLPDFSEEYAVRVRTGFGVANVSMTLENGWNLTSINQQLDSKTAENITAVADLLKAAAPGGLLRAQAAPAAAGVPTKEMTVVASNIPIGYYEAVVASDSNNQKRLYGFRYVGFMPFSPCPIEAKGASLECCADGSMQVYGLVFENEVMTFKPLLQRAAGGPGLREKSAGNSGLPPAPAVGPFQTSPLPDPTSPNMGSRSKDQPSH